MHGSWLIRLLFIAALSSILFGVASLNEEALTMENPEAGDGGVGPLEDSNDKEEASLANADEEPDQGAEAPLENKETSQNAPLFIGAGGGIFALILFGSGVFEVVKIAACMALLSPLLTKKSKNDELNKGRLLGFIEGHAGIHFSALRDALHLANGVTAHHLQSLETQGKIISWRDGKLRRYAASHVSPEQRSAIAHPIIGTRLAILETLSDAGQLGLSNGEVAKHLQLSRQLLSYHMKQLNQDSFVEKTLQKKRSPWRLTPQGSEVLIRGTNAQESKNALPIHS